MKITTHTENNEALIAVEGCLDTAATAEFSTAVESVLPLVKKLIFDFTNLDFIASSGLRELVSVNKRWAPRGGEMILKNLNEVVRDVFTVTGLDEVFTIVEEK